MELSTLYVLTGAGALAVANAAAIYGWWTTSRQLVRSEEALTNEKKRVQDVMLLDRWNKAKYYRSLLRSIRDEAKAAKQKTSHFNAEIQKLTDRMIALEALMKDRSHG